MLQEEDQSILRINVPRSLVGENLMLYFQMCLTQSYYPLTNKQKILFTINRLNKSIKIAEI